jgi:hypothetical protein
VVIAVYRSGSAIAMRDTGADRGSTASTPVGVWRLAWADLTREKRRVVASGMAGALLAED